MKRKAAKTTFVHWLQYIALRLCAMPIQAFPINANLVTGRIIGSLMYWFDKRHRLLAMRNIRRSFPEIEDEREICSLAKQSCQHFVMLGIELLCLSRIMSKNTWYHHLEMAGYEKAVTLALRGRGVILVTGH
ncbi:MAG: hypothetical protein QF662_06930, partial [Phycisphaerae bacterium]|nr:hypothetical protein [Phycisphaerae bacterium]